MMKRILIITLSLILIAAVGIAVCAAGNEKSENVLQNETAPNQEMEKGSEPAEPESMNAPEPALTKSDVISLEEYWAALKTERGDEPFTLEEIYLNCVELFKKEQTVVFQSAGFVQLLYDLKNTDYIPDDFELPAPFKQYLITTNPEKISETDVYAVFVASLENCFKDDIYYSDYDYDSKTRNIGKSCSLWFSTEYRVLGYDSYTEYTKALGRRECDVILTATMVSFREPAVCIFTDEYADLQHYESFRSAVEDIGVEFK